MKKGIFITFEGGDGCGKSTQIKLFAEYLNQKDYKVHFTKEPGGDVIGNKLREIVKNPEYEGEISNRTELLIFLTARSSFVEKEVIPYLEKGFIVISDRYIDSTTAYQGYGNKNDPRVIELFNREASQGIIPDMTFLIDIDAKKGLMRLNTKEFGKKDRIEAKGLEYHIRVNEGYRKIAKENPERIRIIKYIDGDIKVMQEEIRSYADKFINYNKFKLS